jgi:uncharacterized protein
LDSLFADVTELYLYNTVLTSMSHDGRRFTYVNQLVSSDQDPSSREEWFKCACCPPNVLRLLVQIGGYVWTHHDDADTESTTIIVHLYIPSALEFDVAGQAVQLKQESNWPWDGETDFALKTALRNVTKKLRIPVWAKKSRLTGSDSLPAQRNGYIELTSKWLSCKPQFTLLIDLEPRLIASHPLANQTTLSLARGPIIYCVEDVDNAWVNDHFKVCDVSSIGEFTNKYSCLARA